MAKSKKCKPIVTGKGGAHTQQHTGSTKKRKQPGSEQEQYQSDSFSKQHAPKRRKETHGGSQAPKGKDSRYTIVCNSIVDRQAARAMQALLDADAGQGRGVTLKSLTLAPHITAKKATYAVTCQALKHLSILRQVVDKSRIAQQPRMDQMSPSTLYILLYEMLVGEGLHHKGLAERLVAKHKGSLEQALSQVLKEAGVKSVAELLESQSRDELQLPEHPRWVRVNTLKASVPEVLAQLQAEYPGSTQDALLPDLLRLPAGTSLHKHPLVTGGQVVMQGKASCMPAHALSAPQGWHCVDCCAAPGNKTTHLAAIMKGTGRVDAFDKDSRRLARLQANVDLTGSQGVIHAHAQDFLSVDTSSQEYAQVRGVILDPSCSGSGTIVSRQDQLLPSWAARSAALQAWRRRQQAMADQGVDTQGASQQEGELQEEGFDEAEMERVHQLAKFQLAALKHALTFPALERLVYSTCSIHAVENELLVQAALPFAEEQGFTLEHAFPRWHRRGLPFYPGCEKLVRTDPFEDETDGFFVAVFVRASSPQAQADPPQQPQPVQSPSSKKAKKLKKTK